MRNTSSCMVPTSAHIGSFEMTLVSTCNCGMANNCKLGKLDGDLESKPQTSQRDTICRILTTPVQPLKVTGNQPILSGFNRTCSFRHLHLQGEEILGSGAQECS